MLDNLTSLQQRLISAAVAIPIFLGILLFAPSLIYYLFWGLVIFAASYELAKIRKYSWQNSLIFGLISMAFALIFCYLYINFYFLRYCSFLIFFIWGIFIPYLFWEYKKTTQLKIHENILHVTWFFIVAWFFTFIALQVNHRYFLLAILIMIWANDSGAYFVGKSIGKRKFSPTISPNKTWEGFWGSIVVTLLVAVFLGFIFAAFQSNISFDYRFLVLAPFVSVLAMMGDLFESMLKRVAGVKDSGNIMPGHGGVFDRIDSWLAVFGFLSVLLLFMQ